MENLKVSLYKNHESFHCIKVQTFGVNGF